MNDVSQPAQMIFGRETCLRNLETLSTDVANAEATLNDLQQRWNFMPSNADASYRGALRVQMDLARNRLRGVEASYSHALLNFTRQYP